MSMKLNTLKNIKPGSKWLRRTNDTFGVKGEKITVVKTLGANPDVYASEASICFNNGRSLSESLFLERFKPFIPIEWSL